MAFNVNSSGCNINRKAVSLWTMTASIKTLFSIEDTEKCYQFILISGLVFLNCGQVKKQDYLLELNVSLYHMLPLLIVLYLKYYIDSSKIMLNIG